MHFTGKLLHYMYIFNTSLLMCPKYRSQLTFCTTQLTNRSKQKTLVTRVKITFGNTATNIIINNNGMSL